jgi:transposase
MISIPSNATIFLAVETVDFRKQIDALKKYIKYYLKKNPKSRAYFFFMSKDRRMIRILTHDGTGFCLITKKIDKGQFRSLSLLKNTRKKLIKISRAKNGEIEQNQEFAYKRRELERIWKEKGCFPPN